MPDNEAAEVTPIIDFHFSPEFGKLVEALAKAIPTFNKVAKDAVNPFFKSKYVDLPALVEATREPLAKQGLVIAQFPGQVNNNSISLTTMMLHSSNQFLRGELWMPFGKNDAQSIGSAITYARRYSYASVLNLIADADDDASAAMPSKNTEITAELEAKMKKQERISPGQVQQVWDAMRRVGVTPDKLTAKLKTKGLTQLEEVTQELFPKLINWINGAVEAPAKATGKPQDHTLEMKRIFATASERGVPEVDVKRWSYETFGVESMTVLDKGQLDRVLEFVKQA